MNGNTILSALTAVALLVSASLSVAADTKPASEGETKATTAPKASAKNAKPKEAKATAKVKLVDINSAGKAELKTLPGISDADADKIIAGRPYYSKANLTTRNIISREVYEGLKKLVVAKQDQDVKAVPPKSK